MFKLFTYLFYFLFYMGFQGYFYFYCFFLFFVFFCLIGKENKGSECKGEGIKRVLTRVVTYRETGLGGVTQRKNKTHIETGFNWNKGYIEGIR